VPLLLSLANGIILLTLSILKRFPKTIWHFYSHPLQDDVKLTTKLQLVEWQITHSGTSLSVTKTHPLFSRCNKPKKFWSIWDKNINVWMVFLLDMINFSFKLSSLALVWFFYGILCQLFLKFFLILGLGYLVTNNYQCWYW
jgi:hypothetical protein